MSFEDRLWLQLQTAAERDAGRRLPHVALPSLRPAMVTLAVVAGLAALVVGVVAVDRPHPPTPSGWQVSALRVPGAELSGGAAGFGSYWTYDVVGERILRVDVATRRVVANLPVPARFSALALTTGSGSVWAVSTHETPHGEGAPHPPPVTVYRIDPGSNRIVARITLRAPAGATVEPLGLFATIDAVWAWGQQHAMRIDPATNRVTGEIHVAGDGFRGFGANDTEAWGVLESGRLVRFDARTGARLSAAPAPSLTRPLTLAPLPRGFVLDRQNGTVADIDPKTGRALWTTRPGTSLRAALSTGNRAWLLTPDRLQGVDARSGRLQADIRLGVVAAESLAADGSTLLVTAEHGRVLFVRPDG